ncbi:MAG: metal ABC transporter substrate-binding protein [Chloroflexota bacterium]|nr:metal ABC transporter substrate-binding protein [Chloroflexota bacterium]
MPHRRVDRLALLLLVVAVIGCQPAPTNSSGLVRVVTTTTVFADMVASVGGDLVEVTSLVPKNADVHTFEPKPADIRAVAQADLLVMNGLGLDDWLEKTMANASKRGTALAKLGVDLGVPLLPGEEPGTQNPHLWLDVKYAKQYVDRIVVALQAADVTHSDQYQRQGAAYRVRLDELDRWVRDQIASIPAPNRKIVTFHDAFPYYAREYGITIVGVAVQAPGQDPSAGDTAALVKAIRAAGVKAIFSEAQFPAKLVEQLAGETGTKVVADLYDDSIGDPPVTTYEAIVRWDTQQLVDALR